MGYSQSGGIIRTGSNSFGSFAGGHANINNVSSQGSASMSHGLNTVADSNYSHVFGNSVNSNTVTGVLLTGNNAFARTTGPTGGTND